MRLNNTLNITLTYFMLNTNFQIQMIHMSCYSEDFLSIKKSFFTPQLWEKNSSAIQNEIESLLPWFSIQI